jgi:hypothetical protein
MVNKLITSAVALTMLLSSKKNENNQESRELKNVYLDNENFKNGTFRIQKSGRYVLIEDIVFNPNPENNFQPLPSDIESGKYPTSMGSPYNLGFFAAITVEAPNVIIDLNGFSIKQSEEHYINQRFFSIIELASSPFIPKQGPITMSNKNNFVAANNCIIRNGKLINSSHHGIHGNDCHNILIEDLEFEKMEVAGIHLNGATESIIRNIKISKYPNDIKVIHTFSQCKIIKSFVEKIISEESDPFVTVKGERINGQTILNNINTCLVNFANGNVEPLFENSTGLPDGNVYGIVLNVAGVVINDLSQGRKVESSGNINIHLENIVIDGAISTPIETIGCKKEDSMISSPFTYGKGLYKGPVGDIINMRKIVDNNFDELILSQLLVLKYKSKDGLPLLNYIEGTNQTFLEDNKSNFVSGMDSMGHTMKGNIGIFISEGINISLNNCHISNIKTIGDRVGQDNLIPSGYIKKQALNSYGFLAAGSEKISLKNTKFENIESENGTAKDVELLYYK